jgi:U3 small nucleolar RNA-associated protein 25
LANEIDLADEPEGEEAEEEIADLDSDNEDQSDPFDSHFVNPAASRLSNIAAASKGEWKDTKLLKSGLSGNVHFSTPAGPEATTGGSKLEGLKDLRLKKKLTPEELTPLQKALGQFVFEYVDVLYGERTLENAEELRKMYSLHALNHVLKYIPTSRGSILSN